MLSGILWINLLGFVGYTLFILAPLAKSRPVFLTMDAVGMVPIAIHYVLLGAPAGAALSLIYALADVAVPLARRPLHMRAAQAGLFLCAIAVTLFFWSGPRELLSLAGTALVILSRGTGNYRLLLIIVLISTIFWGSYGLLTGSYSQLVFSTLYVITCLWRLARPPQKRMLGSMPPHQSS